MDSSIALPSGREDDDHQVIHAVPTPPSSSPSTPHHSASISRQDLAAQIRDDEVPPWLPGIWILALLQWMNDIELWPCWIAFSAYGLVYFFHLVLGYQHPPNFHVWTYDPFAAFDDPSDVGLVGVLFLLIGSMVLAMYCLWSWPKNPVSPSSPPPPSSQSVNEWGNFTLGFTMVILPLSCLSKVLAHQTTMMEWHIGDSVFAIVFGVLLSTLIPPLRRKHTTPVWVKAGCQTDFYISVSLVLLMIDYHELVPLLHRAFIVGWIDTPLLFIFFSWFGWRFLSLPPISSVVTSAVTLICGSSAGIAVARSLDQTDAAATIPIAISSLLTIPQIVLFPFLISRVSPRLLRFLQVPQAAGALLGGTIDSTAPVLASAGIFEDPKVLASAAVVKMFQNVLIAPVSLLVAICTTRPTFRRILDEHQEERVMSTTSSAQGIPPPDVSSTLNSVVGTLLDSDAESLNQLPAHVQRPATPRHSSPRVMFEGEYRPLLPPHPEIDDIDDGEEDETYNGSIHGVPSHSHSRLASKRNSVDLGQLARTDVGWLTSLLGYLKLLWNRFPKFVLAFLLMSVVYNATVPHDHRASFQFFTFIISEWYSTCSFVSIGINIRLFEMQSSLRQSLMMVVFYLIIQTTDVFATLGFTRLAHFVITPEPIN